MYHIYYWSEDGAVEVTMKKIRGASDLSAMDKFWDFIKKTHPTRTIRYEIYEPPLIEGTILP